MKREINHYHNKMHKLPNFRPNLVTKSFFPTYTDVAVINHGECFLWAYASFLMFENIELWDVDAHAFVKYRGRFYDSQVLRGSPDWQDLPATERCGMVAAKYKSPTDFKRMWSENPRRFNTTWRAIEAKAKRILNREK